MPNLAIAKSYTRKNWLIVSAILLLFLLSGCGVSPTQQQADQHKSMLDSAIQHAQHVGVPAAMLRSILTQEQQIDQTYTPRAFFSSVTSSDYFTNISQRYQMLALQVQGLETQATQQADFQATMDLQTFSNLLSQRQTQGFDTKRFANKLTQYQSDLERAQYPTQYIRISNDARASADALRLMGPANEQIHTLKSVIKQLQASHIDTSAMEQQQKNDSDLFQRADKTADFTNLIDQVNTQLQMTTTLSTQAIPYVGAAKLKQFKDDLTQMQQWGIDTSNYQQELTHDQAALNNAKSLNDYLTVSSTIDSDNASIQMPMLKGEANYLLQQYHQQVKQFGDTHQFHDAYDGNSYRYGYEYDQNGVGGDLDATVQSAQTVDDFQAAIDFINTELQHLKAMEADFNDKTPWDQPHATDMQLLQYHQLTSGQVIVVSLAEQTMRLYQDGKLTKAFLVTTGQYAKPSVPGYWHILDRESPTTFKSSEPKGSAFWYPDTKINFAMMYHEGGYFLHDSWWRVNYGPGTQFPHYDTGGDESFAGTGTHGCINFSEDTADWLYHATSYDTSVIIY